MAVADLVTDFRDPTTLDLAIVIYGASRRTAQFSWAQSDLWYY
ncbi:hypothetical protein QQX09_06090 [Demequina sp. SYSU T00192]|uniref:Uncharacterized protein n=1 Tax=Demequina litoralis TaxID=3051660 RepID=A0ABT8G8E6_9MICO|nr:hypothetical protein [Demequina sp. SYSU T00192]MDN4475421.1 hypothetical protein [Demequina sp. SYSU T00192]